MSRTTAAGWMREGLKRLLSQLFCAGAALALFAAYCAICFSRTAVTVQDGEGAELAAAAVLGRVPHAPGFPLYTALSFILVHVPAPNPVYLLSTAAAVLQAAAGALLVYCAWLLSGSLAAAVLLPAAWLLYPPVMRSATDVNVFALHHLLAAGIVLAALRLFHARQGFSGKTCLLGLLCGLGAAAHPAVLLWAPLVLVSACSAGYRAAGWGGIFRCLARLIACALIGLSPYLIVLFAPPLTPGASAAPLESALLGSAFSFDPGKQAGEMPYLIHFLRNSWRWMPLQLLAFFVLAVCVVRRQSGLLLALFLSCALHVWFALQLTVPGGAAAALAAGFYPSLALAAALAAAGAASRLPRHLPVRCGLFAAVGALPLVGLRTSLQAGDARHDPILELQLNEALAELPADAILLASRKGAMGIQYKRLVEGRHKDLVLLIPELLGVEAYRQALLAAHPGMAEALDGGAPELRAAVERGARAPGVFAYADIDPVSGYVGLPLGVVWQWLPIDHDVPQAAVAARLFSFCAGWPDDLDWNNANRPRSMQIKNRSFLLPIELFARLYRGTPLEADLKMASRLYNEGPMQAVRDHCRAALERLTGSGAGERGPYAKAVPEAGPGPGPSVEEAQ